MGGRREETHGNREEKFRPQGTQVPGEDPTWAVTQCDNPLQYSCWRRWASGPMASRKVCPHSSWEYWGLLGGHHLQSVFLGNPRMNPGISLCVGNSHVQVLDRLASPAGPGVKPRPTRHRGGPGLGLCVLRSFLQASQTVLSHLPKVRLRRWGGLQHIGHGHAFLIDTILSSK